MIHFNDTLRLLHITQDDLNLSPIDQVKATAQAGIKWVQYRSKGTNDEVLLSTALQLKKLCQDYGVKLIINDRVALAREIDADGVHLGKEDMHPAEARSILGSEKIIGGTANTMDDIVRIAKAVDYIGLGPFTQTSTKKNLSPVLGLAGYAKVLKDMKDQNINLPVIAIGGILPGNIASLLKQGVYGVAVASYINRSDDPVTKTKELIKNISDYVSV